ncbi:MAG: ORF6N domain-containing protein [Elusimicrobia bacterium]|nr:ORF6N domain-containing protein [Elusimicrobiota bacterium]
MSFSIESVENKIFLIRGQRVMLDRDLAELYGVTTRVLNQAVRRNKERFPEDFMFKCSLKELKFLRSHFVILKEDGRGKHSKYLPLVFSEHGVAMLSSVLNSRRAIQVNILIMRAFIKLRQSAIINKELAKKIEDLETEVRLKLKEQDGKFQKIIEAIKRLMISSKKSPIRIGFKP